jgi:hypothetical protein
MKHQKGLILLTILILSAIINYAQTEMVLECPLANGAPKTIRASDRDYQFTSEDGIVFTSKTDTTVLAVHNALVVIVARAEDKTYDIVLQFKQNYFWYTGVITPKIKAFAQVKPGDIIGIYKPGSLLELTMYQEEKPISPLIVRKYLKCK